MSFFDRKKQRFGFITTSSPVTRPYFRRLSWLPRPPKPTAAFWKKLFVFALYATVFFFVFGTAAIVWISRDLPDPNRLVEREVAQSTKIYDRTGEHLLYEVYQEQKRTVVELSDIAPLAVKATIAIEDKYFYEHRGIRVLSIARAAFNNLIGRRTGAGGASTLTHQLIKVTMLCSELTIWR